MRALILVAGAALAVTGCGDKEAAQNTAAGDGDLATQTIASNDTTSIDAASGEDANMAAETTIMPPEDGNETNAAGNSADDDNDDEAPADNRD